MRRVTTAATGLVWVLVGAWALSSLWYPFGWDQGIIAWVGAVILDGGMPYQDAFDLKGPAAYYVFALAQFVFGHNAWGIRVVDLVGLFMSAWLVAGVVRSSAGAGPGRWAAALLVLWFASLTFWHTAQPDGFAAMFLCLGVLPLVSDTHPTARRSLWTGLMIGLTVAIKPHYAAFLLVPLVYLWSNRAETGERIGRSVALVLLGSALSVGAFVAWFAYRGALDSLVEVHLLYNAQAYSSGASLALGERLRGLVEYILAGELFVVLLPAALVGAVVLHRTRPALARTMVTWWVVALGGVVLQNKYFDYQWIPMFPPVVVLAVSGLASALPREDSSARAHDPGAHPRGYGVTYALAAVIFVHAAVQPAFEVANWLSYVAGFRDEAAYFDTFGVPGDDYRMTRYIEENSSPDDRLIVMGWNLEILYMADRPTVSRLAFSLPVWMGEGTDIQQTYREELMNDLQSRPPELIVIAEQAEPLIGRPVSLSDFQAFQSYLAARYEPEAEFGPLALYRLRS